VARLRAAGAIVVGKTTTSEYGWSASTVCRVSPPARNPWNRKLSPGGSSGGAAVAVAAGLCDAAIGTDGAGSIRIPAAFCGVVGFKPTFGRIPYVPPGAERLAHAGPLANNVRDASELMDILAGPNYGDPDSRVDLPVTPAGSGPLRIGWLEFPGTSPEVRRVSEQAVPVLRDQGHRVEHLEVPFADPYPALVDIIAVTEAASTRPEEEQWCDPGRVSVIHHGRSVSGVRLMNAEQARSDTRARLQSVMDDYDLLAMATVPVEPFDVDAIGPSWAAEPSDLQWLAWSPASYPFNLTGQPALSLPVGLTSAGLPVGLQLVGRVGADAMVLTVASRTEEDLDPMPAPIVTRT
jgi:aspartyl-tRNA(Asn)/glutamyl-tRNA(Gln) amidotransferase subunit A